METANPAIFQLQKFSIPKFSLEEVEPKYSILDIALHPAGTYNTSNGEFLLVIAFIANAVNGKDKEDLKPFIELSLKGYYIIEGKPKGSDIPDFFYQNSLAIIFPYIRSFVSSLTLQAGLPLVVLPLLNLSHLSSVLKSNTKVFE